MSREAEADYVACMLTAVRILDLTDHRGDVGPWMLARLGADVIKVEPPGGSPARAEPPVLDGASLAFETYNQGKRSIVLDPDDPADVETLRELLATVDVLFDSGPPGWVRRFGIDAPQLATINPSIISVLVTPFGSEGPRADDPASDLTIAALGGPVRLQGTPDRAPVRMSIPQVWRHAGAEAAVAAMVALLRRPTAGPQFVDVSAQAAMTWTMLNAMEASRIQGTDFERSGSDLALSLTIPLIHPTIDGHVVLVAQGKTIQQLWPRLAAEGVADATWGDEDWTTWDARLIDGQRTLLSYAEVIEALDDFTGRYTKQHLLDLGIELGITVAPVNDVSDLLEFAQLGERGFWVERAGDDRGERFPGGFALVDGVRLGDLQPVGSPGGDGARIRAELASGGASRTVGPAAAAAVPAPATDRLPLAGLKVADFSWIGVGPITAKCLADHGAEVIRVESADRIDGLRVQPPFADGIPGVDRSQFFGAFNTSKKSVTVDLKTYGGLRVARSLADWADVVIDSFTPGTMARLGLGPDELRATNPSVIITVTTSLLGGGGSYSSMAGYGYHAAAVAGFFGLVGWPELPPDGPWIAYTDTIAPRFVTPVLLAAVLERDRTGEGCHIEVAQLEAALHFLAPELAQHQRTGHVPGRIGNRDHTLAPQGVYRCAGDDEWVAISITDDAAWRRFRLAIDDPPWSQSAMLDHAEGRARNHDAIDIGIESWTVSRSEGDIERVLLEAGVPAARVARSSDLAVDPQYLHRNFFRTLPHPEMGAVPYAGHQYSFDGYDNGPRFAAPLLGEHTYEVLTDVLGYSPEAFADLVAQGALT